MAKRQKLTNSADETNLGSLLSGDSVFTIPYFQRPYKWKADRLQQLQDDVLQLVDEATDNHFLGAVIIHGRHSNPSDPDVYEVIDGQQRITTAFIYLCAVVKTLARLREFDEAAGLFLKYLVINRQTSLATNAKLQSSKDDRKQLNRVIEDILDQSEFVEKLGSFTFKPIPAASGESSRVWNNYKAALRFLTAQAKLESVVRVRSFYRALIEQVSVVQIDVFDPINGPKIFDSLNSRQEPMTTGDLVRNEIFSRVADHHPTEVESLDDAFWQPFYDKFRVKQGSYFDDYFFPFGLIRNPNLKKSDIYAYLRKSWQEQKDPALIIKDLSSFQDAFLDLIDGGDRQQLPAEVATMTIRLSRIIPTSTFPFLMQLLNAIRDDQIANAPGVEMLELLESFLVRRAICGHEPTGLHAIFKRLWEDCNRAPSAALMEAAIRSHKTVVWPSAEDVKDCVRTRNLYGSSITNFVLCEWNRSLGGDHPTAIPWIEHVLPEAITDSWRKGFSDDQHKQMKDRLSNLIPLSQKMNQVLTNGSYEKKRGVYSGDSMFKAARNFADENAVWTIDNLVSRSEQLAEWAVKRWKS